MMERVRARRAHHRRRGRAYRVSFAGAGFVLVLLGIVLALPLVPGPGLVLLLIGLGMLAVEFDWAERLLDTTLGRAERAAGERTRLQKVVATLFLVLFVAAAVATALVWGVPFVGN